MREILDIEIRLVSVLYSWLDQLRSYRFENEWVIKAPLETVWDNIVNVEDWPVWWQGLEFSCSADKLPVGTEGKHYKTGWKSPLYYRLEINAVIRESTSHALIIADIHGDIEGICTCRIEERQSATRGYFSLNVRTNITWMSLFSPFLKGYFIKNHNRIMAKGLLGFTMHLARSEAAA